MFVELGNAVCVVHLGNLASNATESSCRQSAVAVSTTSGRSVSRMIAVPCSKRVRGCRHFASAPLARSSPSCP